MEYITLYNGIQMPLVGFGTWDLRGAECEKCVLEAIDNGYRLIDTAKMYGNEKEIGKALQKSPVPRETLFITTKLNSPYASYIKAKAGIEQSLKDLQVDYLDLLLIHEPYSNSSEMYKALEEYYRAGKVRAIGVSNFHDSNYRKLIKSCQIMPMVNQVEAHVFFQQTNLQRSMQDYGTIMQAWSPLAAGKKSIFTNETLRRIGDMHHKSPAQVALRFLVQEGIVVIPKSANTKRMQDNINIFDFILSDTDMKEIKAMDNNRSLFGWYD